MTILYNPFFLLLIPFIFLFISRVALIKTGLIYIVKKTWRLFTDCFHVYQFFKVPAFDKGNMQRNQLYHKVYVYLNSLITSFEDSDFTNLFSGRKPNEIVLRLDPNQVIEDDFLGAKIFWINDDDQTLVLKIRKADKRRVLRPYLQHIHTVFDEFDEKKRDLKLYMNVFDEDQKGRYWRSVPFAHPSTFENISMESDLKNKVKSDLDTFLKAKQYYHKLGRVWKRSYLLFGTSGTGKSSFVAAMANFMSYDVYDIDLSKVSDGSDLRFLLLQTTNKSLIVVEDLDRYLSEKSTVAVVSLSGILNFMDGILSSSVGEEKVMVFTVNDKDHVDLAILRPGRIDVQINFPLCDFTTFKTLANSYLGVKDHKLFPQVEEIFHNGSSLSPAEIGELMIANRNSPSRALKSVIKALQMDGYQSFTNGRRFSENGFRKPIEEIGEPSGAFCKEGGIAVKELKKLYSLLRVKNIRKSQSFDLSNGQKDG